MILSSTKWRKNESADLAGRPYNNLLQMMLASDFALIAADLEEVQCEEERVLYEPGDSVEQIYFPCGSSLTSFMVVNEDGRDIEIILIGREGAAGGIISAGQLPAYCKVTVKYSGSFVRLPTAVLQDAKANSKTMRNLFTRYADCLLAQVFQSTACNAIHSIEQRAAKWIVAAMERTGSSSIRLTHDQLANMLGVGRSYTSRMIQSLKSEGVLKTGRGTLLVEDAERLRSKACLCNEAVKTHFDAVLKGAYPSGDGAGISAA